jgi:uncharacterized oligopeptide transporter (OPT) family protein
VSSDVKPAGTAGGSKGPVRHGPYPELTWPAVVVGWLLGAMIALSIGYAALVLGFSIEGSELAAILGWGILRGMLRRTSIVENNINQTVASAVNGASSGMMFTVPALFILARENPDHYGTVVQFNSLLMVFACITGAVLGLAFIIPLRKQMIDFNRLAYPGGIAVAAILKAPGAGMRKALLLLSGAAVSGIVALITIQTGDKAPVGAWLDLPPLLNITFYISIMTIGVGFLSGRGGLVFGYGGFICYFFLAPLLAVYGTDSVKQMMDPPPRQAMIQADNARPVVEAIRALEPIDPGLAGELREATRADEILKLDLAMAGDGKPAYDELQGILAERAVLDVAAAEVIERAAQRLETHASEVETSAPADAAELRALAKHLRDESGAEHINAATSALDALGPEVAAAILNADTAKAQLAAIEAAPLTEEEREAVLEATHAEAVVEHIPDNLRYGLFRPTGIGMLIGAAIGGIVAAFPLIVSAVRSMQQAAREKGVGGSDEMPIKLLYVAIIGGAAALIAIAEFSVENMVLWRAASMALLGTLWIWIAGVIVSECLGRTNWSPLSGMTLIAVTILILISSGLGGPQQIISSVMVGVAICVAISQAGDMMLDLKSGYLVGARPRMQQYAQFLGTWLGPILVIVLIFVLDKAYGLGSDKLPAPQGQALASTINGLVGGDAPVWRYAAGAGLGALLAFSGLGGIGVLIGLGFYMPFDIVLTYTIGAVSRMLVEKFAGRKFVEDVGIPIAAGLIVGEALVGVGNAMVKILAGGA